MASVANAVILPRGQRAHGVEMAERHQRADVDRPGRIHPTSLRPPSDGGPTFRTRSARRGARRGPARSPRRPRDRRVGEAGGAGRAGFDRDLVAGLHQLLARLRHERDPPFAGGGLLGHSDAHGIPVDREKRSAESPLNVTRIGRVSRRATEASWFRDLAKAWGGALDATSGCRGAEARSESSRFRASGCCSAGFTYGWLDIGSRRWIHR